MRIEEGTLITLEQGQYSDFQYGGPFRVLKTFDQRRACDAYVAWHTPKSKWDRPDADGFIAWLTQESYIEDVPHIEWHLGDYGFNPEIQGE